MPFRTISVKEAMEVVSPESLEEVLTSLCEAGYIHSFAISGDSVRIYRHRENRVDIRYAIESLIESPPKRLTDPMRRPVSKKRAP